MSYLLVALVVLLIVSSVLWVKPSPRQKRLAEMRRLAAELGLKVKISKPPGAREGEGRLDYMCYRLGWSRDMNDGAIAAIKPWLLVKNTNRGDASAWQGWSWLSNHAPQSSHDVIAATLTRLPDGVTGLSMDQEGVSIFWQEDGVVEDVVQLAEILKDLSASEQP